jgi:hypothetical protein
VQLDLESSVRPATRTATRWLLLAIATLAFGLPLSVSAEDAAPAKAQPAAAPAQPMGNPALDITPTAGVWRDRLRDARRQVLDATAQLDDLNAAYAKALYESPDDKKVIDSFAGRRAQAQQRLSAARAAIPPMVEAARADGVSPKVLDLYEKATLE